MTHIKSSRRSLTSDQALLGFFPIRFSTREAKLCFSLIVNKMQKEVKKKDRPVGVRMILLLLLRNVAVTHLLSLCQHFEDKCKPSV